MRLVAIALVAAGCASTAPVGRARFENRPIAWKVADRAHVPVQPAYRAFAEKLYFFDAYVYSPVAHRLDLPAPRHAMDVNAIDEVPDSTWFENRIGVSDLDLETVRKGPNLVDPDTSTWTIVSSKAVGGSAGFVCLDGRGDRFVLKLDEPHAPVSESATDVVVQRLLWAIGYHVPENSVVYARREQFRLGPKAVVKDEFGNARPMKEADIEQTLARGYRRRDGTYRLLASKYLAGVPLGGWPQDGVRDDDPNDRIPHEHMRVVRGLYVFFAWLQQTDVKEDNTIDMWVDDKAAKTRYVKHYLVDFGKSLGMSAWIVPRPGDAHQFNVDFEFWLRGIVSLGLWKRPYEGVLTPGIQGVGTFDADHYDPGHWRPHANYRPFRFLDRRDLFWAAKILARFSPAQIRAAVEQGRFEEPRAVDYLVETLVARQRITVRWAFEQTASIDRFVTDGQRLCFDDLLVSYRLVPGAGAISSYRARLYDHAGRAVAWSGRVETGNERHRCVTGLPRLPARDGYTIVAIDSYRGDRELPAVEVHLANDPANGSLRIIGIHRH